MPFDCSIREEIRRGEIGGAVFGETVWRAEPRGGSIGWHRIRGWATGAIDKCNWLASRDRTWRKINFAR